MSELEELRAQVDADRQTIVRLTDELADAQDERDRAVKHREKLLADLEKYDGRISGIHDHFRFELNKACGVNAHLQAHNDHLVEVNASLKSQIAEAGLCRELIAERDALRVEVERLKARTAGLCECTTAGRRVVVAADCPACKGAGAVIVEGHAT